MGLSVTDFTTDALLDVSPIAHCASSRTDHISDCLLRKKGICEKCSSRAGREVNWRKFHAKCMRRISIGAEAKQLLWFGFCISNCLSRTIQQGTRASKYGILFQKFFGRYCLAPAPYPNGLEDLLD